MVTRDVDEALLLADRVVVMTSGPAATIGEILDVPFPRPRGREDLIDPCLSALPSESACRRRLPPDSAIVVVRESARYDGTSRVI